MPKNWTGELVGLMHDWDITQKQLADELGVTDRYVSMVLKRRRHPEGAEQRFRDAVDRIIARKRSAAQTA